MLVDTPYFYFIICTSSSMVLGDRDSIRGRACSNFREFVAAPLVERASSLLMC